MIVDVHTHLPTHEDEVPENDVKFESIMRSGEAVRITNSVDDYLAAMSPVDKSFLFDIAPRTGKAGGGTLENIYPLAKYVWADGMNHNDIASAIARRAPDRVIPFMSLHPYDADWKSEYDRAVGDLDCRGIKLAPNYQNFDPISDEAFELFARLQTDGIPVIFHQGTSPMWDAPLTYTHPLTSDRVAMAFPKLKMVLAHLGHPWHADCAAVVRKHPNVWADVSGQFYRPYSFWQGMRLWYEWGVTGKILFASDWPLTNPQDNIDHLRGLGKFAKDHRLPKIPENEIEGIINRDSLEILELE